MENASTIAAAIHYEIIKKFFDGLTQPMKMGLAGRGFLKGSAYSGHFTTEGINSKEAKLKLLK